MRVWLRDRDVGLLARVLDSQADLPELERFVETEIQRQSTIIVSGRIDPKTDMNKLSVYFALGKACYWRPIREFLPTVAVDVRVSSLSVPRTITPFYQKKVRGVKLLKGVELPDRPKTRGNDITAEFIARTFASYYEDAKILKVFEQEMHLLVYGQENVFYRIPPRAERVYGIKP